MVYDALTHNDSTVFTMISSRDIYVRVGIRA